VYPLLREVPLSGLVARAIAWIAIVATLLLSLGGPHIPGWLVSIAVGGAFALGIPAGMRQERRERDFVRWLWRKRERKQTP
jgi:hypothetical protein